MSAEARGTYWPGSKIRPIGHELRRRVGMPASRTDRRDGSAPDLERSVRRRKEPGERGTTSARSGQERRDEYDEGDATRLSSHCQTQKATIMHDRTDVLTTARCDSILVVVDLNSLSP